MSTRRFWQVAVLALAVFLSGFTPASAAVIPISGSGTSGTLGTGQPWVFDDLSGPVWGVPGLGLGYASWTGPGTLTSFDITFIGLPSGIVIDQSIGGDAFFETRMWVNPLGVSVVPTEYQWIPTYIGTDRVRFDAPTGGELPEGGAFFVNVFFDTSGATGGPATCNTCSPIGPAQITDINFNGSFGTADVPEPSTFVLAGLGLAGVGLYRRRKK